MSEEQRPPGEEAAAQSAQPAPRPHRGPPIETADETLSERGEATAKRLAAALGADAVAAGGRGETPWARVEVGALARVLRRCRDDDALRMDMLHYVERIELDYVLASVAHNRKAIIKVDLPADAPSAPTATRLWQAAAWYEREAHDLFGVAFEGNDDLAPLLLFEGFEGRPGLKSFPLHEYEEY
ncbi:MAG: NADH-quinone oxidoreductase subunit C [Dehalococcoidia bacterium]|nr:NADH-quinone oxidoreductase subunit C [Dehalococcoidia bacterium]